MAIAEVGQQLDEAQAAMDKADQWAPVRALPAHDYTARVSPVAIHVYPNSTDTLGRVTSAVGCRLTLPDDSRYSVQPVTL